MEKEIKIPFNKTVYIGEDKMIGKGFFGIYITYPI